ncbi:hypothetical protein FRB99_001061 [Tulasnella sp. 403]|nr:hypothetical protein FRB99_001061 [Tulasnella sp. 403]
MNSFDMPSNPLASPKQATQLTTQQAMGYGELAVEYAALKRRVVRYLDQRNLAERQRDEAEAERDEWQRKYEELRASISRRTQFISKTPERGLSIESHTTATSTSTLASERGPEPVVFAQTPTGKHAFAKTWQTSPTAAHEKGFQPPAIKAVDKPVPPVETPRSDAKKDRQSSTNNAIAAPVAAPNFIPVAEDVDEDDEEAQPLDEIANKRFARCEVHDIDLDIDPTFHPHGVSMDFLGSVYGLTVLNYTYSRVSPALQRKRGHNIAMAFFPNLAWNPLLPQTPGKAGVAYVLHHEEWPSELPLMVSIDSKSCFYMGHYAMVPADALTVTEFQMQPDETRRMWYKRLGKPQNMWSASLRARIWFRKQYGRSPSETETEVLLSQVPEVPDKDIEAAFTSGEESMHVVCLKPVRYDDGLQRELLDKYQNYLTRKK